MDYGQGLLTWRNGPWRGRDTESIGDLGERTFLRIVNGYVSGREIRTMPGTKCVINPVGNGVWGAGYQDVVIDAQRPVAHQVTLGSALRERVAFDEQMEVWSEPLHLHAFVLLRGRPVIIGESGIRVEPITDAAGTGTTRALVTGWEVGGASRAVLILSPDPGAFPAFAANSANTATVGDVIWVQGLNDTNTVDAARLNRRAHKITAFLAGPRRIEIDTTVTNPSNSTSLTGEVGRVRGNRANSFTPDGRSLYGETFLNELLDPEALTCWWVEDPIDVDGNPVQKAFASYVANRQRDFADHSSTYPHPGSANGISRLTEGHNQNGQQYGIPRRLTRRIPYRLVPTVAGNRAILAAPGYGCMFQIPSIVPVTRDKTATPTRGAFQSFNQEYDKPRSLGVPKGVLAVPNSAHGQELTSVRADANGFLLGKYRLAVAYLDEATGEVGQLSEVWEFTPVNFIFSTGTLAGGSTTTNLNGPINTYATNSLTAYSIRMTSGPQNGVSRIILANDFATGVIQVTVAFPGAPGADTFEILGQSLDISMLIMHPGYAMPETMALSCKIFASKVNENALNHIATIQLRDQVAQAEIFTAGVPIVGSSTSSVYGLPNTTAQGAADDPVEFLYRYTLPIILVTTPTLYNQDVEIPEFRVMPQGHNWVKVVRGVMIAGGALGTHGSKKELQEGRASSMYEGSASNDNNRKELTILRTTINHVDNGQDKGWFLGNDTIPSAYGGVAVSSRELWPFPMDLVHLDRLLNCHLNDPRNTGVQATTNQRRHAQRWGLIENPHRWDAQRVVNNKLGYLQLPRGQFQTSEVGEPSVTLSFGTLPLDANKDEDSVAGGEFKGILLIATPRQTYTLAWSKGPAGASPFLVSNEHGCLAPNGMVETLEATIWVAESGPVAYTPFGTVTPLARNLERDFRGSSARFLRDSAGLMRHAFGHYDDTRGLAFMGLFENRRVGTAGEVAITWNGVSTNWVAADDQAKSRFPCDTIVLWNERVRAYSEWQPKDGLEVLWMGPLECSDGKQRTGFLSRDQRISVLDDLFGDENQEPLLVDVTAAGVATATVPVGNALSGAGAIGMAAANRNGLGSYVRAGMDCVIYNPTTGQLKHRSTAVSATAGSLVLATAGTWDAGDRVAIGIRSMTVETSYLNPKGSDPTRVDGVALRLTLRSRLNHGAAGAQRQPLWGKITMRAGTHQSGRHGGDADKAKPMPFHSNPLGDYIGVTEADPVNRAPRFIHGKSEGREQRVTIELFGGAQACLQDIAFGVA